MGLMDEDLSLHPHPSLPLPNNNWFGWFCEECDTLKYKTSTPSYDLIYKNMELYNVNRGFS